MPCCTSVSNASTVSSSGATPSHSCAKALATADRMGAQRYVSQQINYTLQAREAEYDPPVARQCRAGRAGFPLRRSAMPQSASWMTRWPASAVMPATS